MTDDLLLPEGAVLLHIGPYKTGSTALQSALFARREELAQYGVAYPGNWRRLFGIGHALMRWAPRGHPLPDVSRWDRFAAEVREMSDRRVCLSTEDFGRIRKLERSRKIVEDLGADRLHVVAVARAYHRLLPSHWQERVKNHERRTYDEWLREVLEGDRNDEANRSFWTSHDMAWMTSRWLPYLPPERLTVIVSDDSDRDLLPRTFERMLGLPEGLLTLDDGVNASLSFQSTELLRRLNLRFEDRGWSDRSYTTYVQRGVVPALQATGRSALETALPPLPGWADDLVRQRSEARIAAIREAGVNVVGDLDRLLPPSEGSGPTETVDVDTVSLDSAVSAVAGIVEAALRRQDELQRTPRGGRRAGGARVADTAGRALLAEVLRRQLRRFGRMRT